MGNYEIFLQPLGSTATFFALFCLLFSGFCVLKEKALKLPIIFLLSGFLFDFFAVWVEAKAVESQNDSVALWVMFEMILFLFAMFFMSLAASAFVSPNSKFSLKSYSPAFLLGGLGLVSVVLFTIIIPDGEIVNKLRIILPVASFIYLAVGFGAKLKSDFRMGATLALILSLAVAVDITLKFFNIFSPWYMNIIFYIAFALSFLLMSNDTLRLTLNKAQQEIIKYNQKIEEIIKLSPFPIVISRLGDNRIILANDNAIKTFSMAADNVSNYCLHDFFADSHNKQQLLELLEERHEVQDFEVLIKTPQNDAPFWLLTSANIIDYNNDVAIYAAFQDITSRKARENVLQNQATRDPLTGLYNRRYFETEVAKKIAQAKSSNTAYSVLMLDADFFKKVNDTYGHKIGDKVLIELSSKTEKALRDCDIVARYGGEEFLVFLPNINDEQAYKVADRLRQTISEIVVLTETGKEVRFTVSIGVTSSLISDNIDTLIKTADEALYKAKQNGRNRVEIFTLADLQNFLKDGGMSGQTQDENKNIHPVFASENNAEISLLDGADTQSLRE